MQSRMKSFTHTYSPIKSLIVYNSNKIMMANVMQSNIHVFDTVMNNVKLRLLCTPLWFLSLICRLAFVLSAHVFWHTICSQFTEIKIGQIQKICQKICCFDKSCWFSQAGKQSDFNELAYRNELVLLCWLL